MEKTIRRELRHICQEIGVRTFGSEREEALARHVEKRFREAGLESRFEEFPVTARDFRTVSLSVVRRGRRREVPVLPYGISGFTGGPLDLELVYLENITAPVLRRKNPSGKAALVYGGLGESCDDYRRLLDTGVKALLLMSRNHPVPWPIADSVPWNWERAGLLPMVSIPYFEAERMLIEKTGRVLLDVSGRARPARSQNVIGLKKGRGRQNIVVCAHHDTVGVGTGAIDNGTGVSILLALAEKIGAEPEGAKNIALVSFGSEEILSLGSFEFVKRNAGFVAETVFVINIDGEGSRLGESRVSWTGPEALAGYLSGRLEREDGYYVLADKVSPYSDQFAFNLAGVPSAWFMRHNFWAHYYQFHSRRDVLRVVDTGLVASTARIIHEMLGELSAGAEMPFPRIVPAAQMAEISRFAGLLGIPGEGR